MFESKLNRAMYSRGLTENGFDSLLRDEPFLSDNKIFTISRFINNSNIPIFLTKKVGDLDVICRRFEIAVTYTVKTSNPCTVVIDFKDLTLSVEYKDCVLIIDQNLSMYQGEHDKLKDLRQLVLNEILIRYFAKILYAIYTELRWYLL